MEAVVLWVGGRTYANNGRVIGHGRGLVLLDARMFLDAKILHVAASEDDILVDLIRGADLLFGTAFSPLSSKRTNIFE